MEMLYPGIRGVANHIAQKALMMTLVAVRQIQSTLRQRKLQQAAVAAVAAVASVIVAVAAALMMLFKHQQR